MTFAGAEGQRARERCINRRRDRKQVWNTITMRGTAIMCISKERKKKRGGEEEGKKSGGDTVAEQAKLPPRPIEWRCDQGDFRDMGKRLSMGMLFLCDVSLEEKGEKAFTEQLNRVTGGGDRL